MKKIKKILLAFAPLAAITIATPIVLTACSDTSNVTPPSGGTGGGGDAGGSTTQPSFQKDKTNSDSFTLNTGSRALEIIDKYKAAKGQAAAQKVLTDELASFPKKDSGSLASDVLNMWSNNNWFTITNTAKDEKVKETFISNLNITKAEVGTDSKASFDVEYKSAFTDKEGKTYEATQILKAEKVDVDNTTKIEIPKTIPNNSYKIDGKDQPLTTTSLLETVTDPKTNLENVLKQTKLSLDAKDVFTKFINNHNIQHAEAEPAPSVEEGTWSDNVKVIDKKAILTSKVQIDVLLNSFGDDEEWYGLKKTSDEQAIRNAVFTTTNGVNNLNQTFKDLINGKDSFAQMTVIPDVKNKVASFVITLKKSDSTTKTLKLNIKFA